MHDPNRATRFTAERLTIIVIIPEGLAGITINVWTHMGSYGRISTDMDSYYNDHVLHTDAYGPKWPA